MKHKFYIILPKNHMTILKTNAGISFKRPTFPDTLGFPGDGCIIF